MSVRRVHEFSICWEYSESEHADVERMRAELKRFREREPLVRALVDHIPRASLPDGKWEIALNCKAADVRAFKVKP
jgi:hypothetical protein